MLRPIPSRWRHETRTGGVHWNELQQQIRILRFDQRWVWADKFIKYGGSIDGFCFKWCLWTETVKSYLRYQTSDGVVFSDFFLQCHNASPQQGQFSCVNSMVELLWAQTHEHPQASVICNIYWAKLWFDISYSSRPCRLSLICTVWEAPNFRLLNQTQSRKTYVCNYHFQLYRFVGQKNGAGGRPIRCQSSFTQDLQGGDLLLKLFLAGFALLGRCSPCVACWKTNGFNGAKSFTKDGDQELFLGCFTMEPLIAGDRYTIEFSCAVAAAQLTPRWGLPNTSVSSLEEARLSYSYKIQQG